MSHIIFWSWFAVGLVVGTIAHEVGHLVCGAIASIPIKRMVIGTGPVLVRRPIGTLQLEIRCLPIGGYVTPGTSRARRKHQLALYLLGGVLGNFSLALIVTGLDFTGVVPKSLHDIQAPLVLAQVFMIGSALIPITHRVDGWRVGSDGLRLSILFGLHRVGYAALLEPYRGGRTDPPTMSLASSRISHQLIRLLRSTDVNVRRDVWKALRHELAQNDMTPEEEMLVLDALVTDGLIYADPGLRVNLDDWSLRALKLGPEIRTLMGSRGSVLVELGRYEEGKALLEAVVFAHNPTPNDSFMSRVFLARAEHALGRAAVAQDLLMKVREIAGLISSHYMAMVERIEAEIAAAPQVPLSESARGYEGQQTRS